VKKVLVIDIGGTNVKLMISRREKRKFDSGPRLSPRQLTAQVKRAVEDWRYDAISIGFPAPVQAGRIMKDPKHLAKGWIGYNFNKSFGKPTRVMNDAAMQALGSYRGGRMLFLGLGTGLGSTLVWQKNVLPLELGDLPYEGGIIEEVLGKPGLECLGKKVWEREVLFCVAQLKLSFIADYVMLGGGNAKLLSQLPRGTELGHNRNAYLGGCRMWETDPRTRRPKWNVI
jgi:polyphosphate glucokinase